MCHFAVSAKPCLPSLGIIFIQSSTINVAISQRSKQGSLRHLGLFLFASCFSRTAIVAGATLPGSAHLRVGANIRIPFSAMKIMLPPSAIRNPGLERALGRGAVGLKCRKTVGTLGVSCHVTNPTQLPTSVQTDKLASLLICYISLSLIIF